MYLGGSSSGVLNQLSGDDRNAASALIALFQSYGLGSLASQIISMVKQGLSEDSIALALQETSEWKRRFAGNEQRKNAGLSILNPAEYLATERAYEAVLQQYGFPRGFYDSPADFAGFIGRNVSASELQGRAQVASQWAMSQDNATRTVLRELYGLGAGDLAAYALDPTRALPLLERTGRAVAAAAAAERQGLRTDRLYAERLADLGITAEQAEQGYSTIAEMLPTFSRLGNIYGYPTSQRDLEEDVFEQIGKAKTKTKKLASQERATFSGASRGQVGRGTSSY